MSPDAPIIDPALSINEIIRRYPDSVRALNAFGIDTCCGGAEPLARAADDAGVRLTDIVEAIGDTVATNAQRRARETAK